MSFLAIDIGNTRLKWAVYDAMHPGARLLAHGAVFIENIDTLAEDEWKDLAAPEAMIGCCVASDAVRRRVEEQIEELWDFPAVWVVASSQEDDVINGYDHPSRLGADRWVAMIGARWHLLNGGRPRPALVVMVGTAVTVDALDASGHFLGGLILPGHGIMLRALESGTAGLRVPTGEVRDFPTNTSDALTTGGTFAIAGAIDRMYRNLTERCGEPPSCWLTGGAGWKMAPHLGQEFELVETLIFDGLLHIAQRRAQAKRAR